jgi:hypothetical protein
VLKQPRQRALSWRQGKKSVAQEIEQIIAKAGIDAAIKIYHKKIADPKNEYYFDERQFNTVGNRHCLFPDFGPKFWSVP